MAMTNTSTRNHNMANWWERQDNSTQQPKFAYRAVAYYRHSAQDRQENSIAIQQDQVRPWAESNGVEIIHDFMDPGKSGLTAEGRPGFQDMMENWVKQRNDFQYILCLDVSRWGRFQDIDLSAQYSAECRKYGKEVIYTTLGKPREDDPLYPVYVQFERFRAAQYSREPPSGHPALDASQRWSGPPTARLTTGDQPPETSTDLGRRHPESPATRTAAGIPPHRTHPSTPGPRWVPPWA